MSQDPAQPQQPATQPREETPPSSAQVAETPQEASRHLPPEVGGPKGPEPTRYGDWEQKGRVTDF